MKTDHIIIRPALKEDCPSLMLLIKELAHFEKAPDEVSVSMVEFEDAGFGIRPVFKAFVAEFQSGIVGFALYYIRYSTWKGCRMHLEDILVTEKHRGKGIGSLLFDACILEANQTGLNGIVWQVLNWNEPAIAFYKKYSACFDSEWLNCSLSKEDIKNYQLQ